MSETNQTKGDPKFSPIFVSTMQICFSIKANFGWVLPFWRTCRHHIQVLVYSDFSAEYGQLLGTYEGDMPLDQKFDISLDKGYVRGSWVTIVDERDPPSLDLAEVQVYGSKWSQYNQIWIFWGFMFHCIDVLLHIKTSDWLGQTGTDRKS